MTTHLQVGSVGNGLQNQGGEGHSLSPFIFNTVSETLAKVDALT